MSLMVLLVARHVTTLLYGQPAPAGLSVLGPSYAARYAPNSFVLPDVVVARAAECEQDSIRTAPLLVVEVLSTSTRRRDLGEKREIYAALGVPHCWLIDPERQSATVLRLRPPSAAPRPDLLTRAVGSLDRRTTAQCGRYRPAVRRAAIAGGVLLVLSLLLALAVEGRVVTPENRVELAFWAWLWRAGLVSGAGCLVAAFVVRELRPRGDVERSVDWYG